MIPADAVTLLVRLIDQADLMLRQAGLGGDEELDLLADAVSKAVHTPVERSDLRFIDAMTEALVNALVLLHRARVGQDLGRAQTWAQVVGVIVPVIRADLGRALEARRTLRPTP